jgi:hypothetical protein
MLFTDQNSSRCRTKDTIPPSTIPETPEPIIPRLRSTEVSPDGSRPTASSPSTRHLSGVLGSKPHKIVSKEANPAYTMSASIDDQSEQETLVDQRQISQSRSPGDLSSRLKVAIQALVINEDIPTNAKALTKTATDIPVTDGSSDDEVSRTTKASTFNLTHRYGKQTCEHDHTSESEGHSSAVTRPTEYTPSLDTGTPQPPLINRSVLPPQESVQYRKGPYIQRELTGMALLAANGEPWTAAQVINWIADKLPEYCHAVNWAKSIHTHLSASDDFCGRRIAGEMAYVWTFSGSHIRGKYEKLFAQHPALAPANQQVNDDPPPRVVSETTLRASHTVLKDVIHATNSGEVNTIPPPVEESLTRAPNPEPALAEHAPNVEHQSSREIRGIFMPFERTEDYPALQDNMPDLTVQRETDFFKAFPQYAKPSIDTMSEADIQKKIAEIKNRPSRKAGFGERLSYRKRSRLDPNDETDGACQTRLHIRNREEITSDIVVGSEHTKSLGEAFGLSANPIPVSHQGKLAFGDGTLVCSPIFCP